ncbi:MAG: hypothetical protein ABGX16_24700, partial [Pirellulales bacterium]
MASWTGVQRAIECQEFPARRDVHGKWPNQYRQLHPRLNLQFQFDHEVGVKPGRGVHAADAG